MEIMDKRKNNYKIIGNTVIVSIYKKNGTKIDFIIDIDDLERVINFHNKWYAYFNKKSRKHYIVSADKNRKSVRLHRYLLNAPNYIEVDHINRDPLDNRKTNLRLADHSLNQHNKGIQQNNKTGVKGISWDNTRNRWTAVVQVNNVRVLYKRFRNTKMR